MFISLVVLVVPLTVISVFDPTHDIQNHPINYALVTKIIPEIKHEPD